MLCSEIRSEQTFNISVAPRLANWTNIAASNVAQFLQSNAAGERANPTKLFLLGASAMLPWRETNQNKYQLSH
jgi:hypothetical protein